MALSQTPQDFLPDKYSNLDLPRKDYIDEESEVRILAPYYKLKSEDEKVREFALTSLAAALLVDGMAILLGTVVTRRRGQKSTLRVLQERLADLIRDFWRGFEYLIRAIEQIGRPTLRKYVDNENNLDRRRILEELTNLESRVRPHLELMKRNSSKNPSDYFRYFYDSIDKVPPHIINKQTLEKSGFNYRPVIDTMLYYDIIEITGKNKKNNDSVKLQVNPDYYHELTQWLVRQRAWKPRKEEGGEPNQNPPTTENGSYGNPNGRRRGGFSSSDFGFEERNQN